MAMARRLEQLLDARHPSRTAIAHPEAGYVPGRRALDPPAGTDGAVHFAAKGEAMRNISLLAVLIVASVGCVRPRPMPEADVRAAGQGLYLAHCTMCHGVAGHGDGALAGRSGVAPPDLTTIRQRNSGGFPFGRIRGVIDGREHVAGHGGAGMPIWGDAFLEPLDGYDPGTAKSRLDAVTRYLESLQTD
jgi:mono/diheme cytochrome c family protein